jgi:hypothetical protein
LTALFPEDGKSSRRHRVEACPWGGHCSPWKALLPVGTGMNAPELLYKKRLLRVQVQGVKDSIRGQEVK